MYELQGHEIKKETRAKIPAGDLVTTEYYHPETNELLRKDINVIVDEAAMMGSRTGE
jgi:tRNA(Met) C34 N-acetyltransferase TmcA